MSFIREVIDTVLPPSCCVCGKYPDADGKIPYPVSDNLHLCFSCLSEIVAQPEDRRFFLCMSEPYKGDPYPGLGLYMPFPYNGFFEKAIPNIKFRSRPELAAFLGMLLGSYMRKDGICADLMIPVPLSRRRLKERGFNQAGIIAREASAVAGIAYLEDVLERTRYTERQTEIEDNALRSINVQGAFKVNDRYDLNGLKVIVADDVATTGNTLHEAALEVYKAGAETVLCCALCGNRAVLNAESF